MKEWQRVEHTDLGDPSAARLSPSARTALFVFYVLVLALGILACSAVLPGRELSFGGGVSAEDAAD